MEETTKLSVHAEKRAQQRSLRELERQFIDKYAEEEYVGSGCYRLFMPEEVLKSLVTEGSISQQAADRLRKKVKIQNRDTDVTVFNDCGPRKDNYKKWKNGRPCMWFRGKRVMSIG